MRCNARSQVHRNAESAILFLIANEGDATLSNAEIARALGITRERFIDARHHSERCTLLGGYRIGHKYQRLALADPSGVESMTDVVERVTAELVAEDFRERQLRTERDYRSAHFEAYAEEASIRGKTSLARLLRMASAEVSALGRTSDSTARELRDLMAASKHYADEGLGS